MTYSDRYLQETAASNQAIRQIQTEVKDALELVMGDSSPEMLDEMASIFLEDAVPLIDQIKTGYANQDFVSITMAAHALKGSSATIGLANFANICLAVETGGKQNEANLVSQQLPMLETEYAQIKEALSTFLL
ncbi:MAG: Hpt domain-containing protein [Ardenticatenaceae bacterium]|nr:Hpt domain-containing protein [Anaerolineales bacterium]MCB9009739.1 Hpt domain-containing protein [Ardenticatenaceae bacterium]